MINKHQINKKMKANLFLSAALAATLLAACSNDDTVQQTPADNTPVAARFTAGISHTRATGDQWEAGDRIGIFMLEAGTTTVAEDAWNCRYVTTTTLGKFSPDDDAQTIYFPTKPGAKVDFRAYYPFHPALSGDVTLNITDQTNPAAIDLMYSDNVKGRDLSQPAVTLNFRHRLSRIFVTVTPGNGFTADDLKGLTVTLSNQPYQGIYDARNDQMKISSSSLKTLTLLTAANGRTASGILLPQDGTTGRVLTFVLADAAHTTFTYEIPSSKTFEAGMESIVAISLSKTGIDVADATIRPWDSTRPITGEATMQ